MNNKSSGVYYAQMGIDCYKFLRNSKLVVATYNCTTAVVVDCSEYLYNNNLASGALGVSCICEFIF